MKIGLRQCSEKMKMIDFDPMKSYMFAWSVTTSLEFWKKWQNYINFRFFKNIAISILVPLVSPKGYTVIHVNPITFSDFSQLWIIWWIDFFNGSTHQVCQWMATLVEVVANWMVFFLSDVSPVFLTTVSKSSWCFSDVTPCIAFATHEFIDDIGRVAVQGWIYEPRSFGTLTKMLFGVLTVPTVLAALATSFVAIRFSIWPSFAADFCFY